MSFPLQDYIRNVDESADAVRRHLGRIPDVAIMTGTGLNDLVHDLEIVSVLPYGEIPHFPVSTTPGHAGRLLVAKTDRRRTLILQGRFHLYEGYAPHELVFPLRVLFRCGLRGLILTNAAGGLDLDFQVGDLMLIRDQINMMGENVLTGPHHPDWGPRFPDMSQAYSPVLRALARDAAREEGIRLHEGVYVAVRGPSMETPAETRFFRMIGGDAIGMSTAQEVIACAQAGVSVAAFSCITNINDPREMAPAPLENVLAAAAGAVNPLRRIIWKMLDRWPK